MRGLPSTGLKSEHLVAKVVRSCLPEGKNLPYNWDEKLQELVVGICLSRSLLLQSIAQTRPGHVRTSENNLSAMLSRKRLDMSPAQRSCVVSALKRITRRRLYKYRGKVVLIIDGTSYGKARSRGKEKAMPGKGKVRVHNLPTDETILVPGYQEIWVGILLADQTVLPITRRLWSENGPDCASMNLVEEVEMRRAADIVREVFKLGVILVADSGYRRKDLLHWLKEEGMDFVIRLEGKLLIKAGRSKGLLSDVSARRISVKTEAKEKFSFNAVCLTPTEGDGEPMFLATTLPIESREDLTMIVRLYSWRWGIETFFWKFKQALGADSWRVFSCWRAIERLLTAAHMAYLVLVLMMEFAERGKTAAMRELMDQAEELQRSRFARPNEKMTLGRFLRLIAMDFPNPRLAGAAL
ncbi:MAG: transposase [Elusimicrobia bacterium]|nr:transposase [Elusimicrobiota bacterium]